MALFEATNRIGGRIETVKMEGFNAEYGAMRVDIMSEIVDAYEAAKIALDYLAKRGIVIFMREINLIFRSSIIWVIEIDSKVFTGAIIIKRKTGEVAKEVAI